MGVDYGLKKIGIAITDMMQIVASPFCTIESTSLEKNALKVLEIAENNSVSLIVLGLPVNMNGRCGEMAEIVYKFIDKIKFFSNIELTTVDERLTTAQTEKMLIDEAGISRKKRKYIKDKIAAALILQTYLGMRAVQF